MLWCQTQLIMRVNLLRHFSDIRNVFNLIQHYENAGHTNIDISTKWFGVNCSIKRLNCYDKVTSME